MRVAAANSNQAASSHLRTDPPNSLLFEREAGWEEVISSFGSPSLSERGGQGVSLRASILALLACMCFAFQPLGAIAQDERRCVGDCGVDGRVTVDEVVVGVNIALAETAMGGCVLFDLSRDGRVTVDDLLAAITAALSGCTANRAPITEDLPDYVTYPEHEVRITLPATDPDGDEIEFSADELPPGAELDSSTGVL